MVGIDDELVGWLVAILGVIWRWPTMPSTVPGSTAVYFEISNCYPPASEVALLRSRPTPGRTQWSRRWWA